MRNHKALVHGSFVVLALIIIFPQIPLFLPKLFPPGTL